MLLIGVTAAESGVIAQSVDICQNTGGVYKGVIGSIAYVFSPPEIGTVDTINIITTTDHFIDIEGAAEMDIKGIPLKSPVYVIVAAAADISESVEPFAIL